ncbi:hypothetical protein CAPTEDRAFT_203209 [Capitella teleta]|uniref:BTB domain-containing protein n=1 Tax=Capitella teleta TaxID=283909 RepID=R7TZN7_CAPTE|nr:hypothetical protein CAPTEDRAFT_203209 [Capitella teleta]|eukprot:ELT96846.1 hypothetical protein CAPTEDRAFT_203209 [Capitella teleta]
MMQAVTSLPDIFLQMREAGEFVDINLVFGEQRVSCHKVILAGTCDYFHRMFLSDMLESTAKEVTMKDISASTGVSLVHFLYTGRINITSQNAQDLLAASEMLLLGSLKQKVEEFLRSNTDSMNCLSTLSLARLYDMKTLMEDAKKFLHEHMREVTDSEEMHLLQEDDLIETLEANASQEHKFCFIQKWIRSADARTDRFDDLVQHEILKEKCGSVLTIKFNIGNRCRSPQFSVGGGISKGTASAVCYSYDVHDNKWNELPPMFTARNQHSSIFYNNHLYIVGGINSNTILDSAEELDMESLRWSRLPPLPHPVCQTCLAIVSDNLQVFGGIQSKSTWIDDVWEFDLNERVWQQRAPMPEGCEGGAAVCLDDHVYIVGGKNRTCAQFNPSQDTWTSLQRPQFTHRFGPALVWNKNIIIFGGEENKTIEKYSPSTDTWSEWMLKMPTKGGMRFVVKI